MPEERIDEIVRIPTEDGKVIEGILTIPENPEGFILFAQDHEQTHRDPLENYVAGALEEEGFASLVFDTFTDEERDDDKKIENMTFISNRIRKAVKWITEEYDIDVPIGYFGVRSAGAAAIRESTNIQNEADAVVTLAGYIDDLVIETFRSVEAPTLMIVPENDGEMVDYTKDASGYMENVDSNIIVIEDAEEEFDDEGDWETIAEESFGWFKKHLG